MSEEVFRPYQYSVSLDCTAKGWIQPSIKVLSDELAATSIVNHMSIDETAILLLDNTVNLLRKHGYKVATDIEDVPKEKERNGQ